MRACGGAVCSMHACMSLQCPRPPEHAERYQRTGVSAWQVRLVRRGARAWHASMDDRPGGAGTAGDQVSSRGERTVGLCEGEAVVELCEGELAAVGWEVEGAAWASPAAAAVPCRCSSCRLVRTSGQASFTASLVFSFICLLPLPNSCQLSETEAGLQVRGRPKAANYGPMQGVSSSNTHPSGRCHLGGVAQLLGQVGAPLCGLSQALLQLLLVDPGLRVHRLQGWDAVVLGL